MDHFAEGLRVLGVLNMVKKYPLLFSPMFTDYEPMPLNSGCVKLIKKVQHNIISKFCAESLRDLVTVQYSEKGTHSYELEQQAWIHFIDFLDDCAGGLYIYLQRGTLTTSVFVFRWKNWMHYR